MDEDANPRPWWQVCVVLDNGMRLLGGFNVMDHIVARNVPEVQAGPNAGRLPLWNSADANDRTQVCTRVCPRTCASVELMLSMQLSLMRVSLLQYGFLELHTQGLGDACRLVATESAPATNFSADLDISFSPARLA